MHDPQPTEYYDEQVAAEEEAGQVSRVCCCALILSSLINAPGQSFSL